MKEWTLDEITKMFNEARAAFSRNCCSGIIHVLGEEKRCGCWRCREERGEPWDDETEAAAQAVAEAARKAYDGRWTTV